MERREGRGRNGKRRLTCGGGSSWGRRLYEMVVAAADSTSHYFLLLVPSLFTSQFLNCFPCLISTTLENVLAVSSSLGQMARTYPVEVPLGWSFSIIYVLLWQRISGYHCGSHKTCSRCGFVIWCQHTFLVTPLGNDFSYYRRNPTSPTWVITLILIKTTFGP